MRNIKGEIEVKTEMTMPVLAKITYRKGNTVAIIAYDATSDKDIIRIGRELNDKLQEDPLSVETLLGEEETFSFKMWLVCIKKQTGIVHFRDLTTIPEHELSRLIK